MLGRIYGVDNGTLPSEALIAIRAAICYQHRQVVTHVQVTDAWLSASWLHGGNLNRLTLFPRIPYQPHGCYHHPWSTLSLKSDIGAEMRVQPDIFAAYIGASCSLP